MFSLAETFKQSFQIIVFKWMNPISNRVSYDFYMIETFIDVLCNGYKIFNIDICSNIITTFGRCVPQKNVTTY